MLPCRGMGGPEEGSGSQDPIYSSVSSSLFHTTTTTAAAPHLSHISQTSSIPFDTDSSNLSPLTDAYPGLSTEPFPLSSPLTYSPLSASDIPLSPQYPASYLPPPYSSAATPASVITSVPSPHQSVHSPDSLASVAWRESVDASGLTVAWENVEVVEQTRNTWSPAAGVHTTGDGGGTSVADRNAPSPAAASATGVEEGSRSRRPKNYQSRKMKVYQWPPQEDPKMEQKRLRAVREFRKRQKEDEEEKDLMNTLHTTTQETNALRQEVIRSRQMVDTLERQVAGALAQLKAPTHHKPFQP